MYFWKLNEKKNKKRKKNPENFLEITQAIKNEEDIGLISLCLLAKAFENIGMEVMISKKLGICDIFRMKKMKMIA